jgi:predicted amidohydrolase
MKDSLKIAAVQFEMAQNNKKKNLAVMGHFIEEAAQKGADLIAFPELCTTGYHFLTQCSRARLLGIAERTDSGPTFRFMHARARRLGITILFGMLERDRQGGMFNTYAVISPDGLVFQHRKVHAFENSAILQGNQLEVFRLNGWVMGCLICYDNNLPENNRVLALKGADLIFAPHQTGGFDIERCGMGRIPIALWKNRHTHPVPLRQAILGPKGREWLLKWLPSRSYDNNVYTVFTNGIGIDGPEVRPGCSMIIDPEGMVIAETTEAADAMIMATVRRSARHGTLAGSHVLARRPSLYGKIAEPVPERSTREIRNAVSGETIR